MLPSPRPRRFATTFPLLFRFDLLASFGLLSPVVAHIHARLAPHAAELLSSDLEKESSTLHAGRSVARWAAADDSWFAVLHGALICER
jgi:hypothetical protein